MDLEKVYETWNDQLKRDVVLAAGTHTLSLVAVDRYSGFGKTQVTVQYGEAIRWERIED